MRNDDIVPGFDDENDDGLKIGLAEVPKVAGCLLLALNGHIDTYNSPRFQKRVRLAVDRGFVRLVFDCGGLTGISSAGIGSFATLLKTVRPKGDIVLFNIMPRVYEILRLLGFSSLFNIRGGFDEALEFFAEGENGPPATFPHEFQCPMCLKKLEAQDPGRFRCPECGAVLSVGLDGLISLG